MTSVSKADPVAAFLKRECEPVRRLIGASVFLSLLNGALMIGGAWILAVVVNDALFAQAALPDIAPYLYILCGIYALRAVMVYGADRAAFMAAIRVKDNVRRAMIAGLWTSRAAGKARTGSGAVLNAYDEGVEALHGYVMQTLPARMTAALLPVAVFICIVPFDLISALILLVTAPLIPVFMVWIGRGAERLSQRQWRRMTYMGGRFFDLVQGLPTLRLFNAARREGAAMRAVGDDFRRDTMAVLRVAFLSSLAMEFFATVSIALIAVLIGFRLFWGEMDFTAGLFILLLAPEFYLPLRRMGATYHAKMDAIGAAEKIVDVMPAYKASAQPRGVPQVILAGPVSVRFCDVGFAYDPAHPVLRDVNVEITAGTRAALTGASGAGKTTFIRLLLGFIVPQTGAVLINGVDLRDVDAAAWRARLGWIGQSPHLFAGSIADNIRFAAPSIEDAAIDDVLTACGMGGMAARVIGENGAGLSGGQAQRVALARALCRRADLLLLDEPAAYLDRDNEALVRHAMNAAAPQTTMIYATHRPESLALADVVFDIGGGAVRRMAGGAG